MKKNELFCLKKGEEMRLFKAMNKTVRVEMMKSLGLRIRWRELRARCGIGGRADCAKLLFFFFAELTVGVRKRSGREEAQKLSYSMFDLSCNAKELPRHKKRVKDYKSLVP